MAPKTPVWKGHQPYFWPKFQKKILIAPWEFFHVGPPLRKNLVTLGNRESYLPEFRFVNHLNVADHLVANIFATYINSTEITFGIKVSGKTNYTIFSKVKVTVMLE